MEERRHGEHQFARLDESFRIVSAKLHNERPVAWRGAKALRTLSVP